jgi:hypothetical protein
MQQRTAALKNKGGLINAEPFIFIGQQEGNEAEVFQMHSLLKDVNRCA